MHYNTLQTIRVYLRSFSRCWSSNLQNAA